MKCIIDNQVVLSRAPEGPLASYIGSFARSLSEQGYALDSIQRQIGAWKKLFDPQEGLSGFLLVANREVCVRAAAAETTTITTVHSKKNFMISIFGSVSGFARFTLRVRARESLTGIPLLLSSQHSSRASPKRTYLPECPEKHSLLVV